MLLAAGVAMVTFVCAMPTFARGPQHAIFSPRGMLFGVRQYSTGGWIGVFRESQASYYLSVLAESFGWLALATLVIGPWLLPRDRRRRFLTLAVFPAAYCALLLTMSLALERNLAPALPILAALVGVAGGATFQKLAAMAPGGGHDARARGWILVGSVVLLLAPLAETVERTIGLARPSTRELATSWMTTNLPPGASVLRESYAPRLAQGDFRVRRTRFAARLPLEEIETTGIEYVLLADVAFGRFLDPALHSRPHHAVMGDRYRAMLSRYREVKRFEPGRWRRGPTVILLQVAPQPSR